VAQRSLVAVEEKYNVSDSVEDPQLEYAGVAIVVKSQNHLSSQTINSNPRLAGMKRHDLDCIEQVKASEASSDSRESLDEVKAYLATDGICTNDLFCSPMIQQPGESRDATDTQGDAPETLHSEDLYQDLESEVGVSDEDGGECVAPESDEEIVDKKLCQSPMKNCTRSKSRKVIVPEPLIPSDSEDDVCRPQQCKRNRASPALERAGRKAKYITRGSNPLPVMPSKTFASRKAKAGARGTGTEVTNSQLRARRRHAPDDDIGFIFLRVTYFFFQSVWMQPGTNVIYFEGDQSGPKGRYHPRPTRAYQTAHTTWAYMHAW
jgi:hypothetical protein